ncbi:MAG: DNA methyltransferase [Cytophagales bacterium]|nr:DNA methyltransferase [Cytophagales bacterium]
MKEEIMRMGMVSSSPVQEWVEPSEAGHWASGRFGKVITPHNINYLVRYGRISLNSDGFVSLKELEAYYLRREESLKSQCASLGQDVDWELSFSEIKEKETTKHVHRLHPYKGKFIPQLVQHFVRKYLPPGTVLLDPFCGSGTTLVQANEEGMHAVGVDICGFNTLLSQVKTRKLDLALCRREFRSLSHRLAKHTFHSPTYRFDREIKDRLQEFNRRYFPLPEFRIRVQKKEIDEKTYARTHLKQWLLIYEDLLRRHNIVPHEATDSSFLLKWYPPNMREEIRILKEGILGIKDKGLREIAMVVLSRTLRSCRATRHEDLATLKEAITGPYYCKKHGKICRPLLSMEGWWRRYTEDTLQRLDIFDGLRSPTEQTCLQGDARNIDLLAQLQEINPLLGTKIKKEGLRGIFTSPPYVGMINYHEQHAYAYETFDIERRDEEEISPLFRGKGKVAQESYTESISQVLRHCKQYLSKDFDAFIVANDKHNLYPNIIEKSGMHLQKIYHRPVLNRTEKDRSPYTESIFHLVRCG